MLLFLHVRRYGEAFNRTCMCVFVDIESDTDDEQKKKLGIKTKRKTVVIFLLSTLAANGQ